MLAGGPSGRARQTQSVTLSRVAGGTRVELEHAGFAIAPGGDDERAGTAAGWHVMLRVLAHYLAARAGRRRACAAVLTPLAAPLAAIGPLLHDARARAGWLCDAGSQGQALAREGERFALRGPGGATVSGHVLALAPPFQLALAWNEVDGVLILRAIQVTPGANGPVLVGAQAWSWSPERPAWLAARAALETAVARLVRLAGGCASGSA